MMAMKRFNKIGYIGAICIGISLAGCKDDIEESFYNTDEHVLQVSASMDGATRAYDNQWEAGDRIVLYYRTTTTGHHSQVGIWKAASAGTSVDFTAEGNGFVAKSGTTYSFVAFYPVLLNADGTMNGNIDVSDQRNQKNLDILAAVNHNFPGNQGKLTLTFRHLMSRLILKFTPGDGMTLDDLKNAKFSFTGNVVLTGMYGATDEDDTDMRAAISTLDGVSEWCFSDVTNPVDATNSRTYSLILFPTLTQGTLVEPYWNLKVTFANGASIEKQLDVIRNEGESTIVNVTVNKHELLLSGKSTIRDWTLQYYSPVWNWWEFE